MPDFLLWQEAVEGLRTCQAGRILEWSGFFTEAGEVATIKAASKTENRVANLKERKRGKGIGKSQKPEGQKPASTLR